MNFTKQTNLMAALALAAVLVTSPAEAAQDNEHYEKAVTAYELKQYNDSYVHLKNALQENPNHIAARLLLAKLYINSGDIQSAEKEAGEALLLGADINLVLPIYGTTLVLQKKIDELFALEDSLDSFTPQNRFEWLLLKGQAYMASNRPDQARIEFEKAAAQFPADVRANNTLATLYLKFENLENARTLIERSLILNPENEKTWQLKGELALLEKDYTTAQSSFEKAYQLDNQDPKVLRGLAKIQMELGNTAELKRYLDLILQQSPGDPSATLLTAVMMLGGADDALGEEMLANLSNSLSNLDETSLQSPDGILFIHAASDYAQGNDENAITLLNTYIAKNPDELVAMRMLVDVYLRNNNEKAAAALLSNHRAKIRKDFGLTLQLLKLYIVQNNTLGAQELLEEAKRGAPGHPHVVMLEAEYLAARSQPEAALAMLQGQNYGTSEPLSYTLLKAKLELRLRRFSPLKTTIKKLLKQHNDNVSVRNFASIAHIKMGQLENALPHINYVLEKDPGNINATFNKAVLHKHRGELDEASALVNGILAAKPNHIASILLVSRILFEKGEHDQAIEWSTKVYNYDRKDVRPAELQMEIYKQTGQWKKALEVALQLNIKNRLNTHYMVELAKIYTQIGQTAQAQRPLNKLFVLWEKDAAKLRELAVLQVRSDNLAGARKSLETALLQNMLDYGVRLDLARLSMKDGDLDAAQSLAAKLELEYGANSQLSLLNGEIQLLRENFNQAQEYFTAAAEQDRTNTAALLHLYELSIRGHGAKAFAGLLEQRIAREPQPAWVVKLLADSYLSQGEADLATPHYEALSKLESLKNNPAILNNLANIYARTDLGKALKTAMRGATDSKTKNPALLDTIGWILARQERHEEALPYLREAYSMNSTDAEIRYHTAVTLLALGREKEAEKELRAAVALGGDFPEIDDARRLLESLQ